MKRLATQLLLTLPIVLFAQSNTEVFVFDLNTDQGGFQLSNFQNISNNEGYDNQPSFMDNTTILYAGTRNRQTDIVKYELKSGTKTWMSATEGGEYSPLKIPGQNAISAIRLDPNGKQRLYRYDLKTNNNETILDTLIVGYHVWFDSNTVVSSVLEADFLSLYSSNLKTRRNTKIAANVGRSLQSIPNSTLISFISKNASGPSEIKSLDQKNGTLKTVAYTLPEMEDMCWLDEHHMLMAKNQKLFRLDIRNNSNWLEVASLKAFGITNISRMAISPNGKKLAIVGERDISIPETTNTIPRLASENQAAAIVQKHIAPYNNGALDFVNAFAENVIVSNFPDTKLYEGREKMHENYARFFKNNTNLSVNVNNRMVIGSLVIDEELVTVNQSIQRQVTVYQTGNDHIQSMTFIRNTNADSSPETIVNQQLEAYNERDIDAFVDTYSNDVQLYNFPHTLISEGSDSLRKSYATFFENTPNLRATIKSRMIIGNKVIDREEVVVNGNILNAIAIYEVENGKIVKVTFIQ